HRAVARGLQVVYLSAEAFTSELIGAIRSNGSGGAAFREKFRTADMVLIDDLQFVEAKDSTQSELVAIWDVLRNRGKTMIFAADRLPCDMAKLSRDARSRFQSGPIAALELPDYALREAIIAAKSAERTVNLPSAVAAILAERLTGSVRDLNSAVDQLATFSTLTKQAVGMADAERVLRVLGVGTSDEVGLSHRGETPTLTAILNATADHFHLSLSDLASRTRTKHIALARQIAMYLAREDGGISLPEIGEALGGRDHSTVVHGCTRAAELVARDAAFARDIADVRARYGRLTATQEPVPVRVKERWRR
ncbi:MAG TPA: DnaA/Hda family protein, partial [Aggregatilineales bacterium]|nr:DnaA/Hda family protein [Aggregatilineales bacterium]